MIRKRRSMQPWNVAPEVGGGNKPNDYSELCEVGGYVSHFATPVASCDRNGSVTEGNTRKELKIDRSMGEMRQILSTGLFEKTALSQAFTNVRADPAF